MKCIPLRQRVIRGRWSLYEYPSSRILLMNEFLRIILPYEGRSERNIKPYILGSSRQRCSHLPTMRLQELREFVGFHEFRKHGVEGIPDTFHQIAPRFGLYSKVKRLTHRQPQFVARPNGLDQPWNICLDAD